MIKLKKIVFAVFMFLPLGMKAQNAYFVDGFHGGIWGHYPVGYTKYITDQLKQHPEWKVNLEIEPETWDRVAKLDPDAYRELQVYLKDQSKAARVEYVNPAYGQPYMFNVSGESIISQFHYGINFLKKHFPEIAFSTYSSEEPCFTSSLPQILKSFGFKYASLKNPNTCWGGYTRAHGGELVNWVGPDGTSILTSPRYAIESLKPNSTWETIAYTNSKEYINAAFSYGIKNPVGMCLQDAGWRVGPWLKEGIYKPSIYTTWRNYFQNVADAANVPDWKFTQEDVLTGLVWGSQVLQKLAQQVRFSENHIVKAEKIASIYKLETGGTYPEQPFRKAWSSLMLSQHHDCWIVPYNEEGGNTWADKVKVWTRSSNAICDSIIAPDAPPTASKAIYLKVYNSSGKERKEWVTAKLPGGFASSKVEVTDFNNKTLPSQTIDSGKSVIFKAAVPAFGFAVFKVEKGSSKQENAGSMRVEQLANGDYTVETDLYRLLIDKKNGGTIKNLTAKFLDNKDFVDKNSERKFNELRGNFYKKGGFLSSSQTPAIISVEENGPYMVRLKMSGDIAGNPFYQIITLRQGDKKIDFDLSIDWKTNERVGEFEETNYRSTNLRKAFYNDKYKLLTLFPLALQNQKVYKNAPFDVTESRLENTFYSRWDSIKNNIVFNWVDVTDGAGKYGMTLFTDHATSYAHGKDHPLGLTTLYSGQGLWGRDYKVTEATGMRYSLLFHEGEWDKAGIELQNNYVNEPLQVQTLDAKPQKSFESFARVIPKDWVISSCTFREDEMYLRIYNTGRQATKGEVRLSFKPKSASMVNLDGSVVKNVDLVSPKDTKEKVANLELPPFGFQTLKISL
mgnify:CR=1 FL=1